MSSAKRGTWAWRAKLAWALLGPSIVLLIQVEAVLVIADSFGGLGLRVDATRWTASVAFAALLLVTAAQFATGLWKRTRDARKELLGNRLDTETKLLSELRSDKATEPSSSAPSPGLTISSQAELQPSVGPSDTKTRPKGEETSPLDVLPDRCIRRLAFGDDSQFRKIIIRFGLEPTWAYQTLDELGAPAARALSHQTQLLDARASGDTTALAVALASFVGAAVVIVPSASHRWVTVVAIAVILLLAQARWTASMRSSTGIRRREEQYYPQLERLLELHRFELYKALAIEAPRDARDERGGELGEWRQGRGDMQYALPESFGDSDVREQVQGLTDLLQGPELIGYEGFVSWELHKDQVQLVFAKAPVDGADGSTSLQVGGSGRGSRAPFDITANSEDVTLTQPRTAVQVPVDGRVTRVSFDTALRKGAGKRRVPVVWFEIRQRGRFIQLLRVPVGPDPQTPTIGEVAPDRPDTPVLAPRPPATRGPTSPGGG